MYGVLSTIIFSDWQIAVFERGVKTNVRDVQKQYSYFTQSRCIIRQTLFSRIRQTFVSYTFYPYTIPVSSVFLFYASLQIQFSFTLYWLPLIVNFISEFYIWGIMFNFLTIQNCQKTSLKFHWTLHNLKNVKSLEDNNCLSNYRQHPDGPTFYWICYPTIPIRAVYI